MRCPNPSNEFKRASCYSAPTGLSLLFSQSHSYGCTYIPVSLKHFPGKPEGSLLPNSRGEHKQFSKSIWALRREMDKHQRKKGSLGVAGRLWSSKGVFSLPSLYRAAADVGKQLNCLSQYIPFRFQSRRAIPIPRWQAQQLGIQGHAPKLLFAYVNFSGYTAFPWLTVFN